MANGLADGATDEDNVRNAQYWSPAEEVAQHSCDQTSEECTQGCCGRDELLGADLNRLGVCSVGRTYLLS